MKPARGPQTKFFSNSCSGIPGLANYEMLNEVCEGNFWGTLFRYQAQVLRLRHLATSNPDIQANPGFGAIGSWV